MSWEYFKLELLIQCIQHSSICYSIPVIFLHAYLYCQIAVSVSGFSENILKENVSRKKKSKFNEQISLPSFQTETGQDNKFTKSKQEAVILLSIKT